MPADAVRMAVLKAFTAVVRGGAYTAQAAQRNFVTMDARQRRFATKLLNEAVERIFTIDYYLATLTDVSRMEPVVEDILRLGICQLQYMDAVPDHAAIDSAVEMCRDVGQEHYTRLVNGVLRAYVRQAPYQKPPERLRNAAEHMAVRYSWPQWIAELMVQQYGPREAESILSFRNDHFLTLRANALRQVSHLQLTRALDAKGIEYKNGRAHSEAVHVIGADNIASSQMFRNGQVTIQGEASQLVAAVAARMAGPNSRILDCCAAPGGKSAAIAAALGGKVQLTAWDVHPHRVELIRKTFARLGVEGEAALHDARLSDGNLYDLVLVDAPCSGLGMAWNSPDIKLQRKQREMKPLVELQKRILDGAAQMVRPGGWLLYSTCTINKEENEYNAAWFVREHKQFYQPQLKKFLPEHLQCEENRLQLLPHIHGTEGFFLAAFGRKER